MYKRSKAKSSLYEIRFYVPAEIFRQHYADRFGQDGLKKIEIRCKIAQVEKCSRHDPEKAIEMFLVFGTE